MKLLISVLMIGLVLLVGCSFHIRYYVEEVCGLSWENETHFCNEFHNYELKEFGLRYMDSSELEKLYYDKWDYESYGECCDEYNYCQPRVKLYEDGYCDVVCDNMSFTLSIDIEDNKAIPAKYMDFGNSTLICDYDCYGIFVGYSC